MELNFFRLFCVSWQRLDFSLPFLGTHFLIDFDRHQNFIANVTRGGVLDIQIVQIGLGFKMNTKIG